MSTEASPNRDTVAMGNLGEAEEVASRLTRLPRPDVTDDDPKGLLERYRTRAMRSDATSATGAALIALGFRFGLHPPLAYLVITVLVPLIWLALVALRRGYEYRFLGTGPDEYRRVTSAGLLLFTSFAVASYTAHSELSRLYVIVTAPGAVLLSLASRHMLRGWIYRLRVREGRGRTRRVASPTRPTIRSIRLRTSSTPARVRMRIRTTVTGSSLSHHPSM